MYHQIHIMYHHDQATRQNTQQEQKLRHSKEEKIKKFQ
jgi:hypothetical protein